MVIARPGVAREVLAQEVMVIGRPGVAREVFVYLCVNK